MPQDQWQDTLADAAETDEKNPPWEIDVYGVIAHDAPVVCDPADRPPTAASKAAGYQSDYRTASERIRKLTSSPMRSEQKPRFLLAANRAGAKNSAETLPHL